MTKYTDQLLVEGKYSKKQIRSIIEKDVLRSDVILDKMAHANNLIQAYLGKDYYKTKNKRISEFKRKNKIDDVILAVFTTIIPMARTEEFTAVIGSVAGTIRLTDYREAVVMAAEIVAVLCETDLYDINSAANSYTGTLSVRSNYMLSDGAIEKINQLKYLPPMICKPQELKTNRSSALLSIDSDSVILKRHNHHNYYVSLRSLNKFNSVSLSLDVEFLDRYEEQIPDKLDTDIKRNAFIEMLEATKIVHKELIESGNEHYLQNKYCKRGRTYGQGYHVNTQGTDYKKAVTQLTNKELVKLV
jgi:hypothetical protein